MASVFTFYYSTIASGTNALVFTTAPYKVAANQGTGPLWTPQAPVGTLVLSGAQPFSETPLVLGASFGTVTEQIPLQLRSTTHDANVGNLRALRQALYTASVFRPVVLGVRPDTATNTAFYEVYGGDVQELPDFFNAANAAQRGLLRCIATITRQAFGTGDSTVALWTGQTFTNNPTAGSPNNRQMTVSNGDRAMIGQPIDFQVTAASADFTTSGIKKLFFGTLVNAVNQTARSDAISTSSTSGVAVGATWSASANNTSGQTNVKHRVVARVSGTVANLEMAVEVRYGSSTGALLWTSDWVSVAAGSSGTFVDFGGFALPSALQLVPSATGLVIQPKARSTGGTATGTLSRLERLVYLTWGVLETTIATTNVPELRATYAESAPTSFARIFPDPLRLAGVDDFPTLRGKPPVAADSARLYLAWMNGGVHTDAGTLTVTTRYAPQFATLRGGG